MKTMCGRLVARDSCGSMPTLAMARKSRPPMSPFMSVPNDREYPQKIQTRVMTPRAAKLCMMVPRAFLERVMPA